MKRNITTTIAVAVALTVLQAAAFAQTEMKNVKLHVNPRWSQCSFQLDQSLTQEAWHEFTQEAALVAYFRPLTEAKPMGRGNFEVSILEWATKIDDTKDAWNDTFVHPYETHWLMEGERLAFPGLAFRAGITDRIDVGAYLTKAPGANYGFWAGQVQYNVVNDLTKGWAASARVGVASLYGPDDLGLTIYGLDVLASKEFSIFSNWLSVAPYAGFSTYLSNSHETSPVVDLRNEHVLGGQAMVGAVTHVSFARIAAEYSFAKVSSLSFKLGVTF